MGLSFFWAVRQHILLAVNKCFGMAHRSHFQGSSSRIFLLKYSRLTWAPVAIMIKIAKLGVMDKIMNFKIFEFKTI